jgi:hypothetical protein
MLLGFSWLHAQLSGTFNITGNPTPGPGEFTTIQQAFTALMSQGVGAGGVTFVVQESWRTTNSSTGRDAEPPTIQLSTYPGAGPGNPVTLTFSGLADTVYFAKSPDESAGDRFIFRFTGSIKYFTLDGAGKLILKSTTSSTTSGTRTGLIGFVSVGTTTPLDIDAITIRNVIMHGRDRDNTFAGVYIGQDGSLTTGTVSASSNIGGPVGITIQSCTIDSVSRPILVAGRRANTQNIQVLNNELGHPTDTAGWCAVSGIGAIHIRGTVGVSVRGNVVHPERSTNSNVAGIRLDSCEAALVERNWIKGVVYIGTFGLGAYGIALNLPDSYISPNPQTTVVNNMIAGIYADGDRRILGEGRWVISGIFVTAPSAVTNAQVSLIHNSINLFDDPVLSLPANLLNSYVGASSGITLGPNIRGGVVIDGNLIQNKLSPRQRSGGNQAAYGILIYHSSLASSIINYQCYRINANPANNYIGCLGNPATAADNYATLSAWQTAISGEANSVDHAPAGDVPFLSNIDLHLDPSAPSLAINAGNSAYNGASDFDGQTRPLPINPPGGPGSVNNPPDPGTAPDIGADELDGTPYSCPSSLQAPEIVVTNTYPPLAGSDYVWGQQVEIDTTGTNSPTPSGNLELIYSLDGGVTWTTAASITSFPVIFTLPPLNPPTYTAPMRIAVRAWAPGFCNLTADTSNNPVSINLTDRPGNRAADPITINLASSGPRVWTATISDSTNGLGLSNEYTGLPRAQASRDLFFLIQLPACLDSLDISLCGSTGTLTDSYIHLINATVGDTIDSDDGCSTGFLSRIVAIGTLNANTRNASALSRPDPTRDSLLLVQGHTLYLVVEGYGTATGTFTVNITGYESSVPASLQAPDIVVTGTPLAGSNYLWGQQVQIDTTGTNSPTASGALNVIYSLDGGNTWTLGPRVSGFPATITLPSLTPPTYTGTLKIAVIATTPAFCGLTPDTSKNPVSIILTDRPGNRADNAITINLDPDPSSPGIWRATIPDSTDGLATSNEHDVATGARWGSASRDLFFVLTLPECLDSLVLNTCSGNTNFDTRIHFINATTNDTITNDDQGSSCTSAGGSVNPNWLSQLVVFGLPNALQVTQTIRDDIGYAGSAKVVRDTALLVSGNTLYIVVEGSLSTNQGKFELTITGYKLRPSSISVSGAPTSPAVCINSSPITLTATSGATTYIWKVNGTPQANANTATFNFSPTSEGTFNITATAIYNPNGDPDCPTASDSVDSQQPVTITVEDTARAQIADANDREVSGQTLTFTAGSNVTLKVKSTQASGNTYFWDRYNGIPPSGTPTTSTGNTLTINNISAGSYTVILKAVRGVGACDTTRDTVYLDVTTGLRTDAGTFSIFPNPNTGAFTIVAPAMDTYRVQVLDVAGRLVAEDAFMGSTYQMRLSLPAGVYQIRLVAGDKTQIGRLIITE